MRADSGPLDAPLQASSGKHVASIAAPYTSRRPPADRESAQLLERPAASHVSSELLVQVRVAASDARAATLEIRLHSSAGREVAEVGGRFDVQGKDYSRLLRCSVAGAS